MSAVTDIEALPPTEYLVMEVLAARHRLGEPCWTFPSRFRRAAESLAVRGLTWHKAGVVSKTILVYLTEAGRSAVLSDSYRPPAVKGAGISPADVAGKAFSDMHRKVREALRRSDGSPDDMAESVMAAVAGEAMDRLGELYVAESRFRAMNVRDGRVTLDAEPAREVVGLWAGAARSLLEGAENYAEIEMEFSVGETRERYAFTLQKVGRKTPHQMRRAAEAEVASLKAQLAAAGLEAAR